MRTVAVVVLMLGFLAAGEAETPSVGSATIAMTEDREFFALFDVETASDGHRYWTIAIENLRTHEEEYSYSDRRFVGNLMISWAWDGHDLWIHSSDDGSYVMVARIGNQWQMSDGDGVRGRQLFEKQN